MFSFWEHNSVKNVLEFLGMAVSILLLIREDGGENCPCLLALRDSTSETGWTCPLRRLPETSRHYEPAKLIARTAARAVTADDAQLTAQNPKGTSNDVSDLLSFEREDRDHANCLNKDCPPNNVLTERIHVIHPQVVPKGFKISPLPKDILSFVFAAMLTLEESWIPNKKSPAPVLTEFGDGGGSSSQVKDSRIRSSLDFKEKSELWFVSASLLDSETRSLTSREELLGDMRSRWWSRLSEMPLSNWQQRFGQTNGLVPCTTKTKAWSVDLCFNPSKTC